MRTVLKLLTAALVSVGVVVPNLAGAAPLLAPIATIAPAASSVPHALGRPKVVEIAGKTRREVQVRRTTVHRNTKVRVNRRTNVVVTVRRPVRVWVHRPYYGRVVAGVALGTIIVVAAATVPKSPSSELCWYWSNSSMTRGYWDYCVIP